MGIFKTTGMLALAAVVALVGASVASAGFASLGAAANFTVLGLNYGTAGTAINASLTTIHGDVGVSNHSSLTVQAPSTVMGNVYTDPGGTVSGPGTITGSVITQSLSQAVSDALNANTQNALLTPNQTITGNVTTAHTFTGNGGLNVIDINGNINLNNANITLQGSASDVFVINVTGTLSLVGTASLAVNGVSASNVLYNFTGGTATNHPTITTNIGDSVYGTLLAPNYNMTLDGTYYGELIGGPTSIQLMSGVAIHQNSFQPPVPIPEPPAVVLGFLGAVFLGLFLALRRFRRPGICALT